MGQIKSCPWTRTPDAALPKWYFFWGPIKLVHCWERMLPSGQSMCWPGPYVDETPRFHHLLWPQKFGSYVCTVSRHQKAHSWKVITVGITNRSISLYFGTCAWWDKCGCRFIQQVGWTNCRNQKTCYDISTSASRCVKNEVRSETLLCQPSKWICIRWILCLGHLLKKLKTPKTNHATVAQRNYAGVIRSYGWMETVPGSHHQLLTWLSVSWFWPTVVIWDTVVKQQPSWCSIPYFGYQDWTPSLNFFLTRVYCVHTSKEAG